IRCQTKCLGREPEAFSACRKTSVQTSPPECWRGSSRGRQPASSRIECPECLARQGVQRAQRGLFRRTAAGKYRHSCRLSEKSLDFFDSLRPEVFPPGRLSVNLPQLTVQSHPLHPGGAGQIGPLPALAGEKEDLLLLGELHQQVQ